MGKKILYSVFSVAIATLAALLATYLYRHEIAVLDPQGWIGARELDLMLVSGGLMLIVVIPVLILAGYIPWKYREDNKDADYTPEWNDSVGLEMLWWGFPLLIVLVLSIITFIYTHKLDPYKPLESSVEPLTIEVVALDWKWLFIYPEQGIATVNYMQFPEKTPIHFKLSAQAPMNSFWIPRLGGQIYAMPGMMSQLHLIADETGSYRGVSSQFSGEGFSGMTFEAKSTTEEEFLTWVEKTKNSTDTLDIESYLELAKPSSYVEPKMYRLGKQDLFMWIIHHTMSPQDQHRDAHVDSTRQSAKFDSGRDT